MREDIEFKKGFLEEFKINETMEILQVRNIELK